KTKSSQAAQLRVSHPKESNVMGRGIKVSLDGAELSQVKAGQNLTIEIEPGHHKMHVDNTYHSKVVEFYAESGEQVHYQITNRVGFFGWFIVTMLGAGPMYLVIERKDPVESSALPLR
ncbi:MAG TPA: hypothetical protein VF634_05950, partial [Pyrinomonadaceae bacterium]